jgi:hypothetical protein
MSSLLEGAAEAAEWATTLPPGLPLSSFSPVYENMRPVCAGQGRLYGFMVYSSNSDAQYILVFDSDQAPVSGQAPTVPAIPVAATANAYAYWGSAGRWFQRGIWICNSSTPDELTAGAADTWFDAQYVPVFGPGPGSVVSA